MFGVAIGKLSNSSHRYILDILDAFYNIFASSELVAGAFQPSPTDILSKVTVAPYLKINLKII